MDSTNGRSVKAKPPPFGSDWRSQLPPDCRQRILNKLVEILKGHLPFDGEEGSQEPSGIAVRFEERIYSAATSQNDYLRRMSLKMLTLVCSSHQYERINPRMKIEMITEKFEEEMCIAAMDQQDYIQKIDILRDAINQVIASEHGASALSSNSADMNRNPED